MAYCEEADLLVQDGMAVAPGEKAKFIKNACEEMDSKLGYRYVVPVDLPGIPQNQQFLLKDIAIKLATGRFIMAMALHGQSESLHQYALYLIKEAEMNLMAIANGNIDLNAPRVDSSGEGVGIVEPPEVADPFARIPTGWNPDQTSAVTIFEKNFMTGDPEPFFWVPDENISGEGRREKIV